MDKKTVWLIKIFCSILTGSAVLILPGCRQQNKPRKPVLPAVEENGFNNDSAQKALLVEYIAEQKAGKHSLIDTSYGRHDVDFSEVFPVIMDNCVPCHSEDGNGPFVLTSYKEVLKRSAIIRDVMMERIMPPFLADPGYSASPMINAPRLNDSIRWSIVNWIDQGALPAKLKYDPVIPVKEEGVSGTNVRTYYAKEHVINSNDDSYECFVVDLGLQADMYVKALKYHSTNTASIHHIMIYLDTLGILDTLPECWNCMQDDIVNKLIPIDSWSKGMLAYHLTEEFAFHFPKGSKLLFQTHYGDEGNKGQKEKTRLDIFTGTRPKRIVKFDIQNNFDIFFPANTIKTETLKLHTDSAISILGCVPHLHFLARKIEVFAITEKKEKINILKINRWDYLWQGSYLFHQLIPVPAGSTIYMNAVFDNTVKNPQQPNNPVRDVKYDTFSDQEMMVLCLYIVQYEKGDEVKKPLEILR